MPMKKKNIYIYKLALCYRKSVYLPEIKKITRKNFRKHFSKTQEHKKLSTVYQTTFFDQTTFSAAIILEGIS